MRNMFKYHILVAEAMRCNADECREIFVHCVRRGEWTTSVRQRACTVLYRSRRGVAIPFVILFPARFNAIIGGLVSRSFHALRYGVDISITFCQNSTQSIASLKMNFTLLRHRKSCNHMSKPHYAGRTVRNVTQSHKVTNWILNIIHISSTTSLTQTQKHPTPTPTYYTRNIHSQCPNTPGSHPNVLHTLTDTTHS